MLMVVVLLVVLIMFAVVVYRAVPCRAMLMVVVVVVVVVMIVPRAIYHLPRDLPRRGVLMVVPWSSSALSWSWSPCRAVPADYRAVLMVVVVVVVAVQCYAVLMFVPSSSSAPWA